MTRTTLPFARILNLAITRAASDDATPYRAVVDDRGALNETERESVLEIALLMATANGATSPER